MKSALALLVIFAATMQTGCNTGSELPVGFSLPEGDAKHGRALFQTFQCHACHVTEGIKQLGPSSEQEISVTLGGETSRVKTYGELVTSVINPSHRLAKGYPLEEIQSNGVSKMQTYNDTMTVSQLIDLVAFLKSQYKLKAYPYSDYPMYDYQSYQDRQ